MNLRKACTWIFLLMAICRCLLAQQPDQVTAAALAGRQFRHDPYFSPASRNGQGHARFGVDLDTLMNFNKHFKADGVDQNGNPQHIWYTSTVGNPPELGGTTIINASIVPVSLDLLDYDGSPRYVNGQRLFFDVTPFIASVLASPVFQTANYSSSNVPTQFIDAIQRAEYYNQMRPDWHTLLAPIVKTTHVMQLIRGNYEFALNDDGTCCAFVLVDDGAFYNALLPASATVDGSSIFGAAQLAGEITNKNITSFLLPSVFIYCCGNPAYCCGGGAHGVWYEAGDSTNHNLTRGYVLHWSPWIPAGLFPGFQDVTSVSHELSEIFNDPFSGDDGIHGITPWWLAPNGVCADFLEVGDVVEGLPQTSYAITMSNGYTYHPQNVALLQWFEFESPSSALGGAYSYPNTNVLTSISAPQPVNCGY